MNAREDYQQAKEFLAKYTISELEREGATDNLRKAFTLIRLEERLRASNLIKAWIEALEEDGQELVAIWLLPLADAIRLGQWKLPDPTPIVEESLDDEDIILEAEEDEE